MALPLLDADGSETVGNGAFYGGQLARPAIVRDKARTGGAGEGVGDRSLSTWTPGAPTCQAAIASYSCSSHLHLAPKSMQGMWPHLCDMASPSVRTNYHGCPNLHSMLARAVIAQVTHQGRSACAGAAKSGKKTKREALPKKWRTPQQLYTDERSECNASSSLAMANKADRAVYNAMLDDVKKEWAALDDETKAPFIQASAGELSSTLLLSSYVCTSLTLQVPHTVCGFDAQATKAYASDTLFACLAYACIDVAQLTHSPTASIPEARLLHSAQQKQYNDAVEAWNASHPDDQLVLNKQGFAQRKPGSSLTAEAQAEREHKLADKEAAKKRRYATTPSCQTACSCCQPQCQCRHVCQAVHQAVSSVILRK